jgi:transcriptional regulator with XRE-family HTH domain
MCKSEDMDWSLAAAQLLRELRGKRSQRAFSRRLGYRSNVACDWEAARRFPTAAETLRACARLKVDVPAAARAFQPACADTLGQGAEFRVDCWLDALRGSTTLQALSERSGFSRYAIARWLRGQAKPRLPDFLALLEAITGRASDFVQHLCAIEAVPELLESHNRRVAAKRVAFEAPWSEAVLRVIETSGYRALGKHREGYIAARLGISLDEERRVLAKLEHAGVLQRERDGYLELAPLSVDTSAAPAQINRLKAHWTEVCRDRLADPREGDWLGYNVLSCSNEDLERIREALRRAFREVRAIAAASQPTEAAALLNLQLLTWNE